MLPIAGKLQVALIDECRLLLWRRPILWRLLLLFPSRLQDAKLPTAGKLPVAMEEPLTLGRDACPDLNGCLQSSECRIWVYVDIAEEEAFGVVDDYLQCVSRGGCGGPRQR